VAIVPIYKGPEQKAIVDAKVDEIMKALKAKGISVKYDDSDNVRPGWKFAEYELKGVPVQIRIDKTFIKTLKKAFQEADSIQETLKKAIAEQDMAKLVELQQLQQTANILGYYQNNPFVFDPI
jgi:prolyl-tRNA synthetase